MTPKEREDIDGLLQKIDDIDAEVGLLERSEAIDRRGNATRPDQVQRRPGSAAETNSGAGNPFRDFGEFLTCVIRSGQPGQRVDERLFQTRALGMSGDSASSGGFAVGLDFSTMLLGATVEQSKLAGRCTEIPISSTSNGVKLPGCDETARTNGNRWGGISSAWLAESGTLTPSKPKIKQIELNLKKLGAVAYLTDELTADSAALGAFVKNAFASEFSFQIDDALLRGTGAGVPLGVLNANCLVTVSKESNQAAGSIVPENLEKMYSRLPANSVENAAWLINVDCWPQLFKLQHKVSNQAGTDFVGGTSIFIPPNTGISGKPFGTLLGLPIIPMEQCSTCGTIGDVVLADYSAYLLATKGGIQQASSIHIAFLTDELALRFILRIDGQPQRTAPLTPAHGSNTLSEFVVLQTRS